MLIYEFGLTLFSRPLFNIGIFFTLNLSFPRCTCFRSSASYFHQVGFKFLKETRPSSMRLIINLILCFFLLRGRIIFFIDWWIKFMSDSIFLSEAHFKWKANKWIESSIYFLTVFTHNSVAKFCLKTEICQCNIVLIILFVFQMFHIDQIN